MNYIKNKLHLLLNSNLLTQYVIFLLLSLLFITHDSIFGFNPFIVALIYFSYIVSPSTFYLTFATMLISSSIISIHYGLEISIIFLFFVFYRIILSLTKYKRKEEIFIILYCTSIAIIYFLLKIDIYNILNSSLLMGISSFMCIAINKVYVSFRNKNKTELVYFASFVGIVANIFFQYKVINLLFFIFIIWVIVLLENKELSLLSLLISFLLKYIIQDVSIKEISFLFIPLFISIFTKNKKIVYPIVNLLLGPLFYMFFYKQTVFYLPFVAYSISLCFPKEIYEKLNKEFINNGEENILSSIALIDELKKYASLLQDDRFNKPVSLEKKYRKILVNDICLACQKKNSCSLFIHLSDCLEGSIPFETLKDTCEYKRKLQRRMNDCRKLYLEEKELLYSSIEQKRLFQKEIETFLSPLNVIKQTLINDEVIKKGNNLFKLEHFYKSKAFSSSNGDSSFFVSQNDIALFLLSDGMGHSLESKEISSYLVDIFASLYRLKTPLKDIISQINIILKSKNYEEIYATLDLLKIDLSKGRYNLYKMGSFPSFIFRKGTLYKLNQIFPPLGILQEIEAIPSQGEILDGDIFVIMSDGFIDETYDILSSFFRSYEEDNLYNMGERLFEQLSCFSTLEDDKTMHLIRVNAL